MALRTLRVGWDTHDSFCANPPIPLHPFFTRIHIYLLYFYWHHTANKGFFLLYFLLIWFCYISFLHTAIFFLSFFLFFKGLIRHFSVHSVWVLMTNMNVYDFGEKTREGTWEKSLYVTFNGRVLYYYCFIILLFYFLHENAWLCIRACLCRSVYHSFPFFTRPASLT